MALFSLSAFAADNEIYVDQVGATLNLDLEQLGSGNIIGGLLSTAGSLTPLDLDGSTMTLDINQIGSSNTFLGDILADNFTGFFEFDGDSNDFTIQVDPTNTYGGDNGDFNIDVTGYATGYFYLDQTGSSRTFNIQQMSTLDNDWLKILSTGSNGTVCVIQNDGGTTTGC